MAAVIVRMSLKKYSSNIKADSKNIYLTDNVNIQSYSTKICTSIIDWQPPENTGVMKKPHDESVNHK